MTVKELRQELARRKWTQRRLAREAGYTLSGIEKILAGDRPVPKPLARIIELTRGEA